MTAEPGTVLWRSVLPVDASKARELALAVHSGDAEWRSSSADELAGKAVVPTFTCIASFWQNRLLLFVDSLGLDMKRVLHGEQSWEYERAVSVGEKLYGELRYLGVEERAGPKGGQMLVHSLETIFVGEDGLTAVRERMVLLVTEQVIR